MKRLPADDQFSKCVRERADHHCEVCGKYYPEDRRMGLHCSHVYSRRHYGVRFDPLNAFSMCFSCHQWFGGNPVEAGRWAEEQLGDGAIQILEEKKRDTNLGKYARKSVKEIAAHYREQLKIMREKRAKGQTGKIDFDGYF